MHRGNPIRSAYVSVRLGKLIVARGAGWGVAALPFLVIAIGLLAAVVLRWGRVH